MVLRKQSRVFAMPDRQGMSQARIVRETIALVSCVKRKRHGRHAAEDLYISPLFRFMRAYAEKNAGRWFILSAKYGLVAPTERLESYEQTLGTASAQERRAWAEQVFQQMTMAGIIHGGAEFLWLAGRAYQAHLSRLLAGFPQHDPLAGMGIGQRLSWLKQQT